MVFSPPERRVAVTEIAGSGPSGATACANHARNAAVINCTRCGIFICTLCRIDADGMSLCPGCFDRLSAEGALASTRRRFRDYGRFSALNLALGFILFPIAPVFGPIAVYYAIWAFKQKGDMGAADSRIGPVLMVLLGLLELAGGVVFWVSVLS